MAEDFGAFITSRRRELELTLGDVATELDVSPVTVSNWSNGQSTPDTAQLDALAALLEVPAAKLVSLSGGDAQAITEAAPAAVDTVEVADVEEVAIPEPDLPSGTSEIDEELAELIEEGSAEVEVPEVEIEVPAFVAAAEPTPAPKPAPARAPRRQRAATATAERPVSTLPLTYIEDPKQLMRYRIRWGLTVAALVIMFLVLIWAAGGLISALSDIKESVTPGGSS